MDHLKSDECGEEGREMFSLHDHIFFSSSISMNTFYSGAEIFIFFIVVVVFWKYTHHFLDFLQDIKYHSLHGGYKFFAIQIHVIRNDKTGQGFIMTLRTMYEERSPS